MTIIRISGRNKANPPGCEPACMTRANGPGRIPVNDTVILAFPATSGRTIPRPTGSRTVFRRCCPAFTAPYGLFICLCEACLKVRADSFELSKTDSLANFTHYVKVKVQVMVGVQDGREKLSSGIKMPQICTGVAGTNRALTIFVNGPRISGVLRGPDN